MMSHTKMSAMAMETPLATHTTMNMQEMSKANRGSQLLGK